MGGWLQKRDDSYQFQVIWAFSYFPKRAGLIPETSAASAEGEIRVRKIYM